MKRLYESLLDDEDILMDDTDSDKVIKQEIEKFLNEYYPNRLGRNNKNNFNIYKDSKGKWIVDCQGDLIIKHTAKENLKQLTNGLFKFGKVNGDFNCNDCYELTTLEGCPEEVKGSFWCEDCEKLKSLKGAPKKIIIGFSCRYCDSLTTLEDGPEEVECKYGGIYNCSCCQNLKSLKGAPKKINRVFNCGYCQNLKSLEGAPKEVGNFICFSCKNLKSLEGAPKNVNGKFDCGNCEKTFTEEEIRKYSNIKGEIYY